MFGYCKVDNWLSLASDASVDKLVIALVLTLVNKNDIRFSVRVGHYNSCSSPKNTLLTLESLVGA